MTKKSKPLDLRIADLIHRLLIAASASNLTFAVGGAIALRAYGVHRYTSDVDAFFLDADRAKVLRALRLQGLEIHPVMAPFHYIALDPTHDDPDIRIDVLFPAGEPELSAIEFPFLMDVAGAKLPVFSVELLVASKFYSDRIKDEADIAALLDVGAFEPETVRGVIALSDPASVPDFDALITRLTTPRPPKRRPPKKA